MKFTIHKGDIRPSFSQRTGWLIRQGIMTTDRVMTWRVRFERPDVDTHIKLCGIHDLTWRMERVRYGGSRQLLSMTHEESRRVIAHFRRDSVVLHSYVYTEGKGPATVPNQFPSEMMGRIEYGSWAKVTISADAAWVGKLGPGISNAKLLPMMPGLLRSFSGAHADNGPSSPCAPCDIHFEIEVAK